MRGRVAWLIIARGRKSRIVRGYVTDVNEGSPGGATRTVEVIVQPALAILQRTRGSRIFANQTIPDIAKDVFKAPLPESSA